MKDTLITVKITIYGIVFVNIHGIGIRIIQEYKMIFPLRKILHITTFACKCLQLLELYAKKLNILISRSYFCNEKLAFYMLEALYVILYINILIYSALYIF